MRRTARSFSLLAVTVFAAGLIAVAAFVAAIDPYWLWRERVDWRQNPALETRMRFAKALQVVLRQPEVVLLGSSVVYRGIDPAEIRSHSAYNLGISSLRAREAEVYVQYLLRWAPPKRIVLGVDYFAFDRLKLWESGFDPALAQFGSLVKSGVTASISATALGDAWHLARNAQDDPDGEWQRDGFKRTPPRTSAEVEAALSRAREFFSRTEVAPTELDALRRIIASTRRANVELLLFIPPYHRSWIDASSGARRAGMDFTEWTQALSELARQSRVELWDFASVNPFADAPVGRGSLHYLDPSHFSPLLGRWILQRLGIAVQGGEGEPPDGFGVHLSAERK